MTAIVHQGSGSLHIVHSNATEYARTDVTALATLLTMAWVSVTMGAGGLLGAPREWEALGRPSSAAAAAGRPLAQCPGSC